MENARTVSIDGGEEGMHWTHASDSFSNPSDVELLKKISDPYWAEPSSENEQLVLAVIWKEMRRACYFALQALGLSRLYRHVLVNEIYTHTVAFSKWQCFINQEVSEFFWILSRLEFDALLLMEVASSLITVSLSVVIMDGLLLQCWMLPLSSDWNQFDDPSPPLDTSASTFDRKDTTGAPCELASNVWFKFQIISHCRRGVINNFLHPPVKRNI